MMNFETASKKLKNIQPTLQSKFGIKKIGLFGSIVRNEQNENSDLDILVEINHNYSLFEFAGIINYLEQELNDKVDLSEVNHLRVELADIIKREVVYL